MTCRELQSSHCDFLDGRLDADQEARCRVHLEMCAACARRHDMITRSLVLLSDVPAVEPSSDFHERLQHRILHLQDEMARHDRFAGSGTMASLAIAAALALIAWGPLVWPEGIRDTGPAVAQANAERSPAPGMASVEWFGAAPGSPMQDGPLSVSAAFPGPYSPLIVEAPVTRASGRAARAVFAAYYPGLE